MKGIVLAGGSGTRLHPMTRGTSKQLLPIYDKPMVYYPVSALMLAGIRDILVISTPEDLGSFRRLLGTGEELGVRFRYAEQPRPEGLAQALVIGSEFCAGDDVCLVLGDNIFYGQGFSGMMRRAVEDAAHGYATIFGYTVPDPRRYGVVTLDADGIPLRIVENRHNPKATKPLSACTSIRQTHPKLRHESNHRHAASSKSQQSTRRISMLDACASSASAADLHGWIQVP